MEELRTGTKVRTREGVTVRRFAADFPGWGAENYRDFLIETPAGLTGMITSVNSHGSKPWTRYSIRLDDGSYLSDVIPGRDFDVI